MHAHTEGKSGGGDTAETSLLSATISGENRNLPKFHFSTPVGSFEFPLFAPGVSYSGVSILTPAVGSAARFPRSSWVYICVCVNTVTVGPGFVLESVVSDNFFKAMLLIMFLGFRQLFSAMLLIMFLGFRQLL